jgi:hypothetical protein
MNFSLFIAEVRVQQQNAAKTKLESQMEDLPSRAPILAHAGEKYVYFRITSSFNLRPVYARNFHRDF